MPKPTDEQLAFVKAKTLSHVWTGTEESWFEAGWDAGVRWLRSAAMPLGVFLTRSERASDPEDVQMVLTRTEARAVLALMTWYVAPAFPDLAYEEEDYQPIIAAHGPCDEWRPTTADEQDYPDCARCAWTQEDHRGNS